MEDVMEEKAYKTAKNHISHDAIQKVVKEKRRRRRIVDSFELMYPVVDMLRKKEENQVDVIDRA